MNFSPSFADRASAPEYPDGTTVLVVEEDRAMACAIAQELRGKGYKVAYSGAIESSLDLIHATHPSAILIDRPPAGEEALRVDALGIVEAMRSEGDDTPVLVISELASVEDRIDLLDAGCDDYLVKPFDMGELSVRVEVLLRRRAGDHRVTRLRHGEIEMDLVERKVTCAGRPVPLKHLEFKLLECFMRRAGEVLTREMLLEDVWNLKHKSFTNVVDVLVSKVRRKLDPTGSRRFLINVRGVGFKLNIAP